MNLPATFQAIPAFHFHRGLKSIPAAVLKLVRPFTLRQVYSLVPRLTARVNDADIRVTRTTPNSAVIQWHPGRQLAQVPPAIHRRYIHGGLPDIPGGLCRHPRGSFQTAYGQDQGEHSVSLRGDDCCEWEFTWETARSGMGLEVWGGAILSAALLVYTLGRFPGWEWAAAATALLPAWCGWLLWRTRRLADRQDNAERLLLETRDSAEKQFDEFPTDQRGSAALQHHAQSETLRVDDVYTRSAWPSAPRLTWMSCWTKPCRPSRPIYPTTGP